jgi:hypothetical protein
MRTGIGSAADNAGTITRITSDKEVFHSATH